MYKKRGGIETSSINGALIALVFCMQILTKLLALFIAIPYNIVIMECIAALLMILLNKGKMLLSRPLSVMLVIVGLIFAQSAILTAAQGIFVQRVLHFVMYGFFSAFCIQFDFDEKSLRRTVMYCGLLYTAYLYMYAIKWLVAGAMSVDDTMDLAYTSLVPMFAAIWTLIDKDRLFNRFIALLVIASIGYFILMYSANRGALVALMCFVVIIFLGNIRSTTKRTIVLISVICIGVVLICNLLPVLEWINDKAMANGYVIKPLFKMIQEFNNADNIGSGRGGLYQWALDILKGNYFIPSGVGSFYLATGHEYPHNMLIELGLEIGLHAIVFCFYLIFRAFRQMLYDQTENSKLLVFLFCLSIPRLMVSSTIWENFYFWPMIVLLFDGCSRKNVR